MALINPIDQLGGPGDITPPPGVQFTRKDGMDKQLYGATLQFEGLFLRNMVTEMQKAASSQDDGKSDTAAFTDLANQQLSDTLTNSGGLGIAAVMYEKMLPSLGAD